MFTTSSTRAPPIVISKRSARRGWRRYRFSRRGSRSSGYNSISDMDPMKGVLATKSHKTHKMILSLLCLFVANFLAASAQTSNSRDAFFAAIRRGAAGEVERLLKNGVGPNIMDAEGTSALMAATLFADARIVE